MAGPFGLTPQGWVTKPLSQILLELDNGLKTILGASAGTEPDGSIPLTGMAGQLKSLLADTFSAQWDLMQLIWSNLDPAGAVDAALDVVCSLTGTTRLGASFSSVTATATGDPGTQLRGQGSTAGPAVASVKVTNSRFDASAAPAVAATIAALPAWGVLTPYMVGQRVTNAMNAYQCTMNGTSAGLGPGPTGTTLGADILDGTCHWVFIGPGTGAVDLPMVAEVSGPIGADPNTLTQIQTPISGWRGVTNLASDTQGQLVETNPALRVRREAELAQQGTSTHEAIRAALLKVGAGTANPVTSVKIIDNETDLTDANGLPPHSLCAIVLGGADADVANALWKATGGSGIFTYGNTTVVITDSQQNPQTVNFFRPIAVPIYISLTVFYDPKAWPASPTALITQGTLSAVMTDRQGFPPGESVRSQPIGAAVDRGASAVDSSGAAIIPAPAGSPAMPGIVETVPVNIGTAPSPGSSATIAIDEFHIATFDATRIVVTVTPETP